MLLGLLSDLSAHSRYPCLLKKVGKDFLFQRVHDYVNSEDSVLFTALSTSTSVSSVGRYNVAKKHAKTDYVKTNYPGNQIVQAGSSSPFSSFFKSALLPPYTCLADEKTLLWLGLVVLSSQWMIFFQCSFPRLCNSYLQTNTSDFFLCFVF